MRTVVATPALVPFLLARLPAERLEGLRARTCNPEAALCWNIANSEMTWCGLDDGGVVNMGGVMRGPDGAGHAWQIITPEVARHKRAYIRQSRAMLAQALFLFPRVVTAIEAEYTAALRHARRTGLAVGQVQMIGGMAACQCEATR